jgi:hypothetical protein
MALVTGDLIGVRTYVPTNINLAAPGAFINGLTIALDESFLAAKQTIASENGVYVYKGAATPAIRSTIPLIDGLLVVCNEGTYFPDTTWMLTTDNPIVAGTTALTFKLKNKNGFPGWKPPNMQTWAWPEFKIKLQAQVDKYRKLPLASGAMITPTGAYPGSAAAFIGGVLLPDGRVFCVPTNSTTARIALTGYGDKLDPIITTSPFFNKF